MLRFKQFNESIKDLYKTARRTQEAPINHIDGANGRTITYSGKGRIISNIDHDNKRINIHSSRITDQDSRGKSGHGVALYHALAKHAKSLGYDLHSDQTVSKEATHAWKALARRGHKVVKNPSTNTFRDGSTDVDFRNPNYNGHGVYHIKNRKE